MISGGAVTVRVPNGRISYWRSKGYETTGGNRPLEVKIEDLPRGSGIRVSVTCGFCGETKSVSYRYYVDGEDKGGYLCSNRCAQSRREATMLLKHGVKNPSEVPEFRERAEETCLRNHGVRFPTQNPDVVEKNQETRKNRYGNPNYNNSEARTATCQERYGGPSPMSSEEIKGKVKESVTMICRENILSSYEGILDYKDGKYVFSCDLNKDHTYLISYKLMWQRSQNHGVRCTICNPIDKHISSGEVALAALVESIVGTPVIRNDRKIIAPLELDVYIPDKGVAFEFNGIFWHSSNRVGEDHHLRKTVACEEAGIRLFHVWEDDWNLRREFVVESIRTVLGDVRTLDTPGVIDRGWPELVPGSGLKIKGVTPPRPWSVVNWVRQPLRDGWEGPVIHDCGVIEYDIC